jgi:hypothetical protein
MSRRVSKCRLAPTRRKAQTVSKGARVLPQAIATDISGVPPEARLMASEPSQTPGQRDSPPRHSAATATPVGGQISDTNAPR